jgi:AcrR family transcriptional regulator
MNHSPSFIFDSDAPGKALILREALRLFADNGMSATSIRDIAKATGLSNPALYKHFKTKDELANTLFERLYRTHLLHLKKEVTTEPDFHTKFRAFLKIRLLAYDEQPDAEIYVTDNLRALWPHMPKNMKDRTVLSLLRDIILLGRSEGSADPNTDITLQLTLIVGMLENVTRQIFFSGMSGPALAQLDEVERLLCKALS